MKEKLNKPKIDYIFFHLQHHFEIPDELSSCFRFGDFPGKKHTPYVHFPLSAREHSTVFRIDDLPVLYPMSGTFDFYYFDDFDNLHFEHDYLKSAFYLLSGYQETQAFEGDHLGRFTYHDSIQKKLNIAEFPVVNAYFKIIEEGIRIFCHRHSLPFKKKERWGGKRFGLFLTHDVDRVDKWTTLELKRRLKMLVHSGFRKYWKYSFEALSHLQSSENPFWNFSWMLDIEAKHNLKSTWFFLPQGHPQIDAYYSFSENRIIELAKQIYENGHVIGLHGSYNSREDEEVMRQNLFDVRLLSTNEIFASRQHWLSFKYPQTLRILEKLSIKYDSSWGFAEQIGWRNSYCAPFRPYDLENDRMINIWELPLNAMDVTFFQYMGLSLADAKTRLKNMLVTCKKYNGLFTLLWHNNHFDDDFLPGITAFYTELLEMVANEQPLIFLPTNNQDDAI